MAGQGLKLYDKNGC